jgi:hypothetical protein
MKRAAHTAQVEMRVLSRMLETNRSGLESIQEQGGEKESSPPPQYEESNDYQEGSNNQGTDYHERNDYQGNDYQGDGICNDHGENYIYPEENTYNDVEDSSTINIAEACVV